MNARTRAAGSEGWARGLCSTGVQTRRAGSNTYDGDQTAKSWQACYFSSSSHPQPHPPSVLSAPGSRLVRQTSNSAVAGLPMHAAVVPSSCCKGVRGRLDGVGLGAGRLGEASRNTAMLTCLPAPLQLAARAGGCCAAQAAKRLQHSTAQHSTAWHSTPQHAPAAAPQSSRCASRAPRSGSL